MNDAFATALVKIQEEMPGIEKDSRNPHFKSDFVSLDHLLAVTLPVCNRNGVAVMQFPTFNEHAQPTLTTILQHESGESLSYEMPLFLPKNDPQGQGSALTYGRRYALAAALGISSEKDDDAESATVTIAGETEATPSPEPVPGAAPPPQGSARSPATDSRKAQIADRWNKLSAAEAKAKVEEIPHPDLLRELLIVESDRPSPRKGVLTAISKRISVLEGEPPADNGVAQPVPGEAASPSEQLQRLQAALAFVAEQPSSVEDPEAWTVRGVLAGLMANGGGVYSTLEQVPGEWLERVWGALPKEVQQFSESLGPEALTEMAGKAK